MARDGLRERRGQQGVPEGGEGLTYYLSLPLTNIKLSLAAVRRGLHLDHVARPLALPDAGGEMALADEEAGEGAGCVVVDEVGCFQADERGEVSVLRVGVRVVAKGAGPVGVCGEGGNEVGEEFKDLREWSQRLVERVGVAAEEAEKGGLTKSSPAAPTL